MLTDTLRSRWFAACLLAGALLLLILSVATIGGRAPRFQEAEATPGSATTPLPVAKLGQLFAANNWPRHVVDPATQNPFSTTHFIPVIAPVIPPTTRRVEVTYQGYYESANGPRHAMLRVGDAILGVPVGTRVVTNLYVAQAEFKTVTLTNSANQTNVLALNTKKEVEVPLK